MKEINISIDPSSFPSQYVPNAGEKTATDVSNSAVYPELLRLYNLGYI